MRVRIWIVTLLCSVLVSTAFAGDKSSRSRWSGIGRGYIPSRIPYVPSGIPVGDLGEMFEGAVVIDKSYDGCEVSACPQKQGGCTSRSCTERTSCNGAASGSASACPSGASCQTYTVNGRQVVIGNSPGLRYGLSQQEAEELVRQVFGAAPSRCTGTSCETQAVVVPRQLGAKCSGKSCVRATTQPAGLITTQPASAVETKGVKKRILPSK